MTTMKKTLLTTLFLASLATPALAADPAQSAMAGDPTWPYTPQVAPAIVLEQSVGSQAGLERDPTWPGGVALAPGIALDQMVLIDDPLQGNADLAREYYASRGDKEEARQAARLTPCSCPCG